MITFAIPTWNRAKSLKACVESIALQQPEAIVISDDASTDDTQQVVSELQKKYPFITYRRNAERLGFTGNYRQAALMSQSEYTWTFGDDDTLVETALSHLTHIIRKTPCDFYHVSETIRVGRSEAVLGTVWEICNSIGWIDFTGFISCNITRTEKLKEGVNSPNWELFGESSYPQCLAILETMSKSRAMLLELGCVTSAGAEFSKDTSERWMKDQIGWKYLYVANGLKRLVDLKIIPDKVTETFFRYIEETLLGRLMRDFGTRTVTAPNSIQESDWACLAYLAGMISGARGGIARSWVANVHALAVNEKAVFMAAALSAERLYKVMGDVMMPVYPLPYLPMDEKHDMVA